ncbi:hypothetical protein TrRE_jg2731 [Triparma retinervis]|uniref:30S ribosomal protein S17, chloroplastic n=1 Tax=Triparma retinervis TaxID=2557542 RepID=A0A9W7ADN1_9STRA|nr:hypothetical protein TrRE_jg2731 [Triparma retinervis]
MYRLTRTLSSVGIGRSRVPKSSSLPPPVINNTTDAKLTNLERLTSRPILTPKYPNAKIGVVTGCKMSKTVKVDVRVSSKNLKYGKTLTSDRRFYAHDEGEDCRVGDKVRIMPDRPRSKLKRWYVQEILIRKPKVEED